VVEVVVEVLGEVLVEVVLVDVDEVDGGLVGGAASESTEPCAQAPDTAARAARTAMHARRRGRPRITTPVWPG
jgi:hypothetical protein